MPLTSRSGLMWPPAPTWHFSAYKTCETEEKGDLVKVATSWETKRGNSHNRKCSVFTLHILWATITRRNTPLTNESRARKNCNCCVVWRVVFGRCAVWGLLVTGNQVVFQDGVFTERPAAGHSCKSQQAGVEGLGHNMPRLSPWNITPLEHWRWGRSAGTCCGG